MSRKSKAQLNLDGLQLEFTRAVSTLESNISEYRTLCTKLQLLWISSSCLAPIPVRG
jgi:hypothetical protein